jgi:hypothetical protein
MSEDTVSLFSNLVSFIPKGLLITAVASGIAISVFVLRAAFPTRLMKALNASLIDVERLYFDVFETHLFHSLGKESKTDLDLATRLIVYFISLISASSQLNKSF